MSRHFPWLATAICLLCGCAAAPAQDPVEMLDQRTGMTVAGLKNPIVLAEREILIIGTRPGFAYLGPVEWDQMGSITYGLWIHVATGTGKPLADIHRAAAVTVVLDNGALELQSADAPPLGREPYPPVASWGQTAYFRLSVHDLQRLAASPHLALRFAATDGSTALYTASEDTRAVLGKYLQSRGLTGG
jgi:hypothetical protein